MVISAEQFTKYIKHIKDQFEKDDKLSDLLVCEDTTGWISSAPYLIDDVVELLVDMFNDQAELISWFLWEWDEDGNNSVWETVNGTPYRFVIKDAEDLYHYMQGHYDEVKEKMEEEAPDMDIPIFRANIKTRDGQTLYDLFKCTFDKYTESDN